MRTALATLAILAMLASVTCVHDEGEVEINWTIVDRGGAQVFPSGQLGDTCEFMGTLPGTDTAAAYGLQIQVRLCEPGCPGGCDDPACQLDLLRYDCSAARGFSVVKARPAAPYDFQVDLIATPDADGCSCTLSPPCALAPGPRSRTVEPGLVTDLQVYLFVLGLDDIVASAEAGRTRLDLASCCTPDPTCAP